VVFDVLFSGTSAKAFKPEDDTSDDDGTAHGDG